MTVLTDSRCPACHHRTYQWEAAYTVDVSNGDPPLRTSDVFECLACGGLWRATWTRVDGQEQP